MDKDSGRLQQLQFYLCKSPILSQDQAEYVHESV